MTEGWNAVISAAEGGLGSANVSNQDSSHDVATMACALAAARTGRADLRTKATHALTQAIGTEAGARWLAIGRNLGAYVIAASVLGIDSGPIYDWLANFLVRTLRHNNDASRQITFREAAWNSGSNASAQEGFALAALAAYTGNQAELDWNWERFRRYCGDRSTPGGLVSNSGVWQEIPSDPVGIQNLGAVKASQNNCRLDGAISNDMSRGGSNVCDPGLTQYPWVGLQGAVPATLVLARQGYPAWEVMDEAVRRALNYLMFLKVTQNKNAWFDGHRGREVIVLVNRAYGTAFPHATPIGPQRTFGFTDWTHGPGRAAVRA